MDKSGNWPQDLRVRGLPFQEGMEGLPLVVKKGLRSLASLKSALGPTLMFKLAFLPNQYPSLLIRETLGDWELNWCCKSKPEGLTRLSNWLYS